MLIVAIPKSASTSLMITLSRLHNIPSSQLFFKDQMPLANFPVLSDYHSDIRTLDKEQLAQLDSNTHIFKQHIAPTAEHLDALRSVPKVVLLRNPKDIISAYYRAESKMIHDKRKEFEGKRTEEEWQIQAEEIGLINEVSSFHDGWKSANGNQILIYYEDLIANPKEVINKIESYFGLDKTNNKITLSKERYSRVSKGRALLNFYKRIVLSGLKKLKNG